MAGLAPREIAEKDEVHLSLTDLDTAGRLNDYQLPAYLELLCAQSRLLGQSKVDFVKQKKGKYEHSGFNSEILYPVDEHGEVPEANYSKLAMLKVPFECHEYAGAVPLSDSSVRNALQGGGGLGPFTMRVATPRIALDIELLALRSNTDPIGTRYSQFDGLPLQATSHVIDPASAAPIGAALWYNMQLAMPTKYWRDVANMRYYVSPHVEQAYIYSLASETADKGYEFTLADQGFRTTYGGVPIFPIEGMPDGYAILTHKDNIVIVIEEEVTWELEREPKKRRWLYHVHNSFDAIFAVEDAVVVHSNVAVPVASTA